MPVTYVETRAVELSALTRYPGNARRGNVAEIRASLRRTGQYRALVVRDTGDSLVILAGNHTAAGLEAEKHTEARCEIITCTDDEALRIVLADNRIAETGTYDDYELSELLAGLDGDFRGTAWDQEDLNALLQAPEVIGGQATAFLSDIINAPAAIPAPALPSSAPGTPASGAWPADELDSPHAPPPPSADPGYVPVTWLVPVEDRAAIRAALAAAQARWGLETAAQALSAIARDFLEQKVNAA